MRKCSANTDCKQSRSSSTPLWFSLIMICLCDYKKKFNHLRLLTQCWFHDEILAISQHWKRFWSEGLRLVLACAIWQRTAKLMLTKINISYNVCGYRSMLRVKRCDFRTGSNQSPVAFTHQPIAPWSSWKRLETTSWAGSWTGVCRLVFTCSKGSHQGLFGLV